jgi:hypothetical protein
LTAELATAETSAADSGVITGPEPRREPQRRYLALYVGWPLAAACAALAVMRVTFNQPPAAAWRASDSARQEIFVAFVREEPALRARAIRDFPGDHWSADDAFHAMEVDKIRTIAGGNGAQTIDGLRAIDEGLHQRTAIPGAAALTAGVPPCRPRPDY